MLLRSYESESGDNTWRRDPMLIAHEQMLASDGLAVLKISAIRHHLDGRRDPEKQDWRHSRQGRDLSGQMRLIGIPKVICEP